MHIPTFSTHPLLAFNLPQGGEWILIVILALIFFGPSQIPKLARGLGKSVSEFKKAREEFERELLSSDDHKDEPKRDDPKKLAAKEEEEATVKKS